MERDQERIFEYAKEISERNLAAQLVGLAMVGRTAMKDAIDRHYNALDAIKEFMDEYAAAEGDE